MELDQDSSGLLRKRKLETLSGDVEVNSMATRMQDGPQPRKVICLSKLPKPLLTTNINNKNNGILHLGSIKIQRKDVTENIGSSSKTEAVKFNLKTPSDQSQNGSAPSVLLNDNSGRKLLLFQKGGTISLASSGNNVVKSVAPLKLGFDATTKATDFNFADSRETDSSDSGVSSRTSSPCEAIDNVSDGVSDSASPRSDATFNSQASLTGNFYPNSEPEVKQERPSPSNSPPIQSEPIIQATEPLPRRVIILAPPSATHQPISDGGHQTKEEPLSNPNIEVNGVPQTEAKIKYKWVARPLKERWDKKVTSMAIIKEEKTSTCTLQKDKAQQVLDTTDVQITDWKSKVKPEDDKEIKEEIHEDCSLDRKPSLLDKILEQDRINMERLKAMTDPVIKGPQPFIKEWKTHAIGRDFMVYNFSIDFYFAFLKTLLVRAKVLNGSENLVFRYEGVKREDTYTLRQAHDGNLPELVDMLIHVGQIEDVYIYFVPSSIKPSQGLEDPTLKFEQRQETKTTTIEPTTTTHQQLEGSTTISENTKHTKGKKNVKGEQDKNDPAHCKKVQLWQFILVTLLEGQHKDKIVWMGDNGGFKFINHEEFSKLWAGFKGKEKMSYSNLSRSIRNYYKPGIMEKGENNRFSYKFSFAAKDYIGYTIAQMRGLYEGNDPKDADELARLKVKLSQPVKPAGDVAGEGVGEEDGELPDADDDDNDSDD